MDAGPRKLHESDDNGRNAGLSKKKSGAWGCPAP